MTKEEIQEIQDDYPNLSLFGMDVGTDKTNSTLLNSFQDELQEACTWLRNLPVLKTATCGYSSYQLKHHFENDTGIYIPVGTMVLALLHEGFDIKASAPNSVTNISKRSLDRIYKQHRREHLRLDNALHNSQLRRKSYATK